MGKYYIVNERGLFKDYGSIRGGDILRFYMPPFCSGEYVTLIHEDVDGLYIDSSQKGYFDGCRGDVSVISQDDDKYEIFKKEL